MDVEANPLSQRAAVFAALGDPGRLSVAESLVNGDATPSELASRLGMSSNLLAHHLNVLVSAGLVRRVRSEGDGRRTYVHLMGDMARLLDAPATEVPERVVFVCTANTARSQLAASLWATLSELPVASAGTHPAADVDAGARAVAAPARAQVGRRREAAVVRRRPRPRRPRHHGVRPRPRGARRRRSRPLVRS